MYARSRGSGSGSQVIVSRRPLPPPKYSLLARSSSEHAPPSCQHLGFVARGAVRTAPSQYACGVFCRSSGFSSARCRRGISSGVAPGGERVVGEAAHALERRRLVARLADRRRGDDRAVVREQDAARVADLRRRATCRRSASSTPPYSSTNASSPSKMHEFWCTMPRQLAHRREQRRVVRDGCAR